MIDYDPKRLFSMWFLRTIDVENNTIIRSKKPSASSVLVLVYSLILQTMEGSYPEGTQ